MTIIPPTLDLLEELDMKKAVRDLVRLSGWDRWRKRWIDLDEKIRAQPWAQLAITERHHVELSIFPAFEKLRSLSGSSIENDGPIALDAYLFAHTVVRLYEALGRVARKRLEGRVRDALNKDSGFGSLKGEIRMIQELLTLGCRVRPVDLDRTGTVDFIAERGGDVVEVECKFLTQDFRSGIRLTDFRRLTNFVGQAWPNFARAGKSRILRVDCPSGLPKTDGELRNLAEDLLQSYLGGSTGRRAVQLNIAIEDWKQGADNPSLAHSEARWLTVFEGCYTFAFQGPKAALVVALKVPRESDDDDSIRIARKFKDAADQMSGTRPGFILAEVEGPVAEQVSMQLLVRSYRKILHERFFADRPFVECVRIGFPGPPFTLGSLFTIRRPEREHIVSNALLGDLIDNGRTQEVENFPGIEFRKSWWARKHQWGHKARNDMRHALTRRFGPLPDDPDKPTESG